MTVGVGVEGPSDLHFWDKVLHKHFKPHKFDVRNMRNRDKLIRETPKLMETFRDCHYAAGFTLVDLDDDQCVSNVLNLFEESVRSASRQEPRSSRTFQVCVAMKELESWFLADHAAIEAVIPGCEWNSPPETAHVAKGRLRTLWKQRFPLSSFNEIAFAKTYAPKFSPSRATSHSASFQYFWTSLEQVIRGPF